MAAVIAVVAIASIKRKDDSKECSRQLHLHAVMVARQQYVQEERIVFSSRKGSDGNYQIHNMNVAMAVTRQGMPMASLAALPCLFFVG